MPWLATMHPIWRHVSLTRLVVGIDEALRDYLGSDGRTPAGDSRSLA